MENMMDNIIKVKDLSKRYRIYNNPKDRLNEILFFNKVKRHTDFWALRNVSFDIQRGKTVGIIGRNGSGKSTLLQIITGTLQKTFGDVEVKGRISALLELGAGFNPEFTGRQNVIMYCALMGLTGKETEESLPLIESFAEIGEFIDQPVKTYSSGMYVRLAFAAAINVKPDILIVDEALSVGDVGFQRKCYRKFQEFQQKGTTILLVTHDMGAIKQYTDYAILMEKGQVYSIGDPNTIVNEYTRLVSSSDNSIDVKGRESDIQTEYRYGSREAEIIQFGLYNSKGEKVNAIFSGESCSIKYIVKFNHNVKQPIYAMTLKTKSGIEVYGHNTYYKNMKFLEKKCGDIVNVDFQIHQLGLGLGDYFISLGVVELKENDIVPIDRRYDVMNFKVIPSDKSFGLVNLKTDILIS